MERVEIYGHYRQADRQAVRRARQVPARARQRLRPRTPSAPHTPSHPSTPGTRTPSTPPVPSRAAKTAARREPPRLVSWWHARRLNARARQVSRAPPTTPSHPSTPSTHTPSAPPMPSRAAKTGGTPPTPRPPSVSLAKYGGQRNSQQVSAPARDECQPTSAENGAGESTGTSS